MILDLILALCSLTFAMSILPQIIRVYRMKKVDQLSFMFLIPTTVALFVSVVVLFILGLYFTMAMNALQFIEYIILVSLRMYYG